jgi:hypothetical protein
VSNVIIPRYTDLGKAAAEDDDEYFPDCFIDTGLIDRLLSGTSSVSIVVGRTGSGKSGIIRRIRETHDNVLEVHPENLALGYLADSWLLQFLTEENFDLSLFYQQLWRHVIVVELLRFYEGLDNRQRAETFLSKIQGLFRDNSGKKDAMGYLEQYGGSFWSDTDERVKRITDDFERQIDVEAGGKLKALETKYRRGEKIGRHETKELISHAHKIVSAVQMQKLARIIDILDEDIFVDKMKKTLLVIDDLDAQWADNRIRIKLIEALINAIPKFRRVRNVKIVVAMRDDLLDTVLEQATTAGFQRDKFQDFHQRITWRDSELRALIDTRVSKLFRKQYTGDAVKLDDILDAGKGSTDLFGYIIDRTLMRPRDLLAYFNMVFDRCGGRSKVTLKDIRSVEFDYSKDRRQGLVDEWRDHLPCVDTVISFLGHRRLSATFRLGAVSDEAVDQCATQLYADNQSCDIPLVQFAKAHFEDHSESTRQAFLYRLIATLYRIGAVGLRTQENSRTQFSFISKSSISVSEIGVNTWCVVHPMLWQNLGRRGEIKPLFSEAAA